MKRRLPIPDVSVYFAFLLLAIYPLIPGLNEAIRGIIDDSLGRGLTTLFIYALLALALHVVVGDAGMFHLGIGGFFGFGAYIAGILMVKVPSYPFQINWVAAMMFAGVGSALLGIFLCAPMLRLRGDYLALVTLGFGEVIRFSIRNLDEITAGTMGLRPIPPPHLPGIADADWTKGFEPFYYFCLFFLIVAYTVIMNLERSRWGRAWVALREDELAASCMGMNTARLKLAAFASAMFLAGIAGSLYTIRFQDTADPDFYGFNISILILSLSYSGWSRQPQRRSARRPAHRRLQQYCRRYSRPEIVKESADGIAFPQIWILEDVRVWYGARACHAIPSEGAHPGFTPRV